MANPIQPVTARDAVAVTKSNTTVFTSYTAALYVGTGGDVAVRTRAGNSVVFPDVLSGSYLPIECDMVLETGTGASGIVAMFY